MSVHTGVASCTRQILSVTVRNVLSGLGFAEPLSEAKVDDVNEMLLLANTNKEVIRFDISV